MRSVDIRLLLWLSAHSDMRRQMSGNARRFPSIAAWRSAVAAGRSRLAVLIAALALFGTEPAFGQESGGTGQIAPRFELLHLWATDKEEHALRALSDPVRAVGVEWSESEVSTNFLGVRNLFADRFALGEPPSGLFWLGGDRLNNLFEKEYFRLIPDRVGALSFSDELIPEIYEQVRDGDSIMLLPLGIHLQNRMLYNSAIIERLGLSRPETWRELLKMAPVLADVGVYAVALSDERWQLRFLIMSIMAEQFTFDEMGKLLAGRQSANKFQSQLLRSTEIFLALRPYAPPASHNLNWASVVGHVKSGKAFAAIMGDFVAPLIPRHLSVRCAAAPGNDYLIWSFDTIALVAVNDPAVIAGQDLFVETVMQPEARSQYILRKGGVPVYRDEISDQTDDCSRASIQDWHSTDAKFLLTASQWTKTLDSVASILRMAWQNPDASAVTVTADLVTAINLVNGIDQSNPVGR